MYDACRVGRRVEQPLTNAHVAPAAGLMRGTRTASACELSGQTEQMRVYPEPQWQSDLDPALG